MDEIQEVPEDRPASGSWFRPRKPKTRNEKGSQSSRFRRNITTSSSRRSNFWPFLHGSDSSSTAETRSSMAFGDGSRSLRPHLGRRGTNNTNLTGGAGASRTLSRPLSTTSFFDREIFPDYIVNFLRGETPETLARKREAREELEAQQRQERFEAAVAGLSGSNQGGNHSRTTSKMSILFHGEKQGGRRRCRLLGGRFLTGWRGGLALNVLLASLILAVSIACLVVAAVQAKNLGGAATLMTGSCSKVRGTNLGIHVAVNILGVALVVGANYVFQVLSSPTREEVNQAHESKKWLDVGIPSFRNLMRIGKLRTALSAVVVVLATGSLIIYNAITTTSQLPPSSIIFSPSLSPGSDHHGSADPSTCSLTLNRTLLAVITLLNLFSVSAISLAVLRRPTSFAPLVTLGDAVASFLVIPDLTTEGSCLLTKPDIKEGRWGRSEPDVWAGDEFRWFKTVSAARWTVWLATWAAPVALAAGAVGVTVSRHTIQTFSWYRHVQAEDVYIVNGPHAGLAILASLPQILLVILYLSTNALLTTFFLSREFCQFAIPGRLTPLRVCSDRPAGLQTTSLFLTLPRPLSWILFLLFVAMSLMLSQGVSIATVSSNNTPLRGPTITGITFTPLPLAILLGLLVFLALLVFVLSLRPAGPRPVLEDGIGQGNPLALRGGSCSAVISSRCHRMASEGPDVATQAVSWGVVYEGTGAVPGHATFSSRQVGVMSMGRTYA